MSGHTEGTWEYEDYAFTVRADGEPMAQLNDGDFAFGRLTEDEAHDELHANGRLMAAGPTMYEYVTRRAEAGDEEAAEILRGIDAPS